MPQLPGARAWLLPQNRMEPLGFVWPLNENVKREIYPLPQVDEILAQLHGSTIFSKLHVDVNMGFWQIPLAPSSCLLTTFVTPFGHY